VTLRAAELLIAVTRAMKTEFYLRSPSFTSAPPKVPVPAFETGVAVRAPRARPRRNKMIVPKVSR
jgi:hypothetical protein